MTTPYSFLVRVMVATFTPWVQMSMENSALTTQKLGQSTCPLLSTVFATLSRLALVMLTQSPLAQTVKFILGVSLFTELLDFPKALKHYTKVRPKESNSMVWGILAPEEDTHSSSKITKSSAVVMLIMGSLVWISKQSRISTGLLYRLSLSSLETKVSKWLRAASTTLCFWLTVKSGPLVIIVKAKLAQEITRISTNQFSWIKWIK